MSPEEARSQYKRFQNQYDQAYDTRRKAENAKASYESQRSQANNYYNECESQKINFEQRLEDVINIINFLEINVENQVSKTNQEAGKADSQYVRAIKCNEIQSASIISHFRTKSVTEDYNTNSAYNDSKREKERLEKEIAELAALMNQVSAQIGQLGSLISNCNNTIADCNARMNSAASNADYYRRFMN